MKVIETSEGSKVEFEHLGKGVCIDGKLISETYYDLLTPVSEEVPVEKRVFYADAGNGKGWFFVNAKGEPLYGDLFEGSCKALSEEVLVKQNGKWGVIKRPIP